MAINLESSIGSMNDADPVGTMTFSTNANRVLVCGLGNHQGGVTNCTLNGTALTKVIEGTTGFNERAEIWFYNNPPSGGQGTILWDLTGGSGRGGWAAEFSGVSQTGQPSGSASNVGTSTSPLIVGTTSVNNSFLIDCFYSEGSVTVVGQTQIKYLFKNSYENLFSSYRDVTSAGLGTNTWTLDSGQRWAGCAIWIEPVAGTAGAGVLIDGKMLKNVGL